MADCQQKSARLFEQKASFNCEAQGMGRDEEGACDQPGDLKKLEKRREQNRLAKKRSREKKKHDQVRNEGKTEEEKTREGGDQFARTWGMLDQQDRIISELESQAAQREEQIRGLERQNMRLNELCDSKSAFIREVRDDLRESNERKSGSIQEPVQVSHSELLASPRPSQESQLNEYGDVGARRPPPRQFRHAVPELFTDLYVFRVLGGTPVHLTWRGDLSRFKKTCFGHIAQPGGASGGTVPLDALPSVKPEGRAVPEPGFQASSVQ
jgi:hypothetical protein